MAYDPADYPGYQPIGAPGMDFTGAEPQGGAQVNRQMAQMAMRKKRKPMITPEQMRERMAQEILAKYSFGTDQPVAIRAGGDRFIPAAKFGINDFAKYGYNHTIDFGSMTPEERNILSTYSMGAQKASR